MSKKKHEFTLNIGISSILFIFIILALVSFATLSLSSAMSDYKLTSRLISNSENYYAACEEAEEALSDCDETLSALYATGISRAGYYEKVGKKKTFTIPVTDIQTLNIEIKILYPEEIGENFYKITSFNVMTTGELEYDDGLDVFK